MENLAYLHLAFDYEEDCPDELISIGSFLNKAAAPDWSKLSGRAWRYMLPLALTLAIFSSINGAFALQKGDRGPSVRELQSDLKQAGFYQAAITQVYDVRTEEAVKKFQKSVNLQTNGIAGPTTLGKLEKWRPPAAAKPANKPKVVATQTTKPKLQNVQAKTPVTQAVRRNKVTNPNFIQRGDEGEDVRILQERLRIAGYYFGNSTGIFGPITEEAVKRFQTAYNLKNDGIVGSATIRRLPPNNIGYGEETPTRQADPDKLRLGDRGEAVRVLQQQLIQAGYLTGQPNGYFGAFTADAVKRFQTENYLAASGIAGSTTRGKLYEQVKNTPKSEFETLEIQRRLNARGFYKGPLNGVLGDDTKRAIKQAQQYYGISLKDVKNGQF
ncbi:peptidoglycan-binding domain-containing protein [Calothrix sp. PCC 6303]|uniref:peptidoglycan-binding domain-containing protein n=1 Tax=Calothrix sp. PCC 6303 TaxID=1170562 RepID=UPI0002A03596|nr:peptidoglycan-binding protein [Calothrix sp. PCC 6303]AFZ01938.1 Peptidoglycan-binding domain 1 protein [Calothrix sp. PCC 6303]